MSQNGETTVPAHYAPAAKWLHWIIAGCVLFVIPAGVVMLRLPDGDLQNRLFDLHRSFGVLIFVLAVWRVYVRSTHGAPASHPGLTRAERIASTAAHHLLYVLIIVMPLLGWAMTSAYRVDVSVFGLFTLPHLVPQSDKLYEILSTIHKLGGILMALIVGAHIAGALKHTIIDRSDLLWRMLPNNWSK